MPKEDKSLINWSEISRRVTGDRTQIRSDYSGKKYKSVMEVTRFYEDALTTAIELYNNANKKDQ